MIACGMDLLLPAGSLCCRAAGGLNIDTCSTIPLLPKSEISSLQPLSVAVQPGLC